MGVVGRLRTMLGRGPRADIVVAVVLLAVVLLTTVAGPAGRPLDAEAVLAGGVACGVLALRRRGPLAVLLVSVAAAELYLLHDPSHRGVIVLAAPLVAVYTVAETSQRRRALWISGLTVLASAGIHVLIRPSFPIAENIALAALGAMAVAAGDASRNRRAYLAEARARALHAEADREAEAARRVTEERLRIARELHDALGHQLALITVQAGVAARVLSAATVPAAPQVAVGALDHIRSAAGTALAELSETIGLLRQQGEAAHTEPPIGLVGVEGLVDSFRRSGLAISTQIEGAAGPIPLAADLTAYRILQESLTNVTKHAGPTSVAVRLTYRPDAVQIVIDNAPGAAGRFVDGAATDGRGLGLVGMRERVAALGGSLQAGPRPDGGYRVSAGLPLTTVRPA